MTWSVNVQTAHRIIETHYSGTIRPAALLESTRVMLTLVESEGIYRILCDCSKFFSGIGVLDLMENVEKLAGHSFACNLKMALLLPPSSPLSENARLWEYLCSKHLLTTKVFNDRHSSLEWLLRDVTSETGDVPAAVTEQITELGRVT